MEEFNEYLDAIAIEEHRQKLIKVFSWIDTNFPNLSKKIAWKQPMYIDHGTYIIGFSVAKNNFAIGPEKYSLDVFRDEVEKAGYETTQQLIKIKWDQEINFELLKKIMEFNINEKKDCTTFWYK